MKKPLWWGVGAFLIAISVALLWVVPQINSLRKEFDSNDLSAIAIEASSTVSPTLATTSVSSTSLSEKVPAVVKDEVQEKPKRSEPPEENTKQSGVTKPVSPAPIESPSVVADLPIEKAKPIISSSTMVVGDSYLVTLEVTDARWPKVPEPKNRKVTAQAVVALLCEDYKGNIWSGTGNIINPQGYILTNRHVGDDAKYCEVAVPPDDAKPFSRSDLANLANPNRTLAVPPWQALYKAVRFFVPSKDGLGEKEREGLDFAILKITEVNKSGNCALYEKCLKELPANFPYNPISDFYVPTSTAPAAFPIPNNLDPKFNLYESPYELLMYGYPSQGLGKSSPIMRGNIGHPIAYLAGDQKFADDPFTMVVRTFDTTYGGSSGSGMFYNGYIVGLIFANFNDLRTIQLVVPMPLISKALKENNMEWMLRRE